MAATIFGDLVQGFDQQFSGFMAEKVAVMTGALLGPVTKLFIATWIVWWLLVAMGQVEDTVFGAFKKFLKIVVFTALILNTGNYLKYIAEPLYSLPDQLAGLFVGRSFIGSYQLLDNTLTQGADLAKVVSDLGSGLTGTLIWYINSLVVWVCTILMVGFGGIVLLLTKFYLIVVLSIGQVFILCLFWRSTRIQFELWLKQVLTLIFTTWFAFIIIGITFKLWSAQIGVAAVNPENGLWQLVPMIITTLLGVGGLWGTQWIARALGGGWHLDAQAAAGFVRGVAFSPVDRFARTAGGRIQRTFTRESSPRNENRSSRRGGDAGNWPATDAAHRHYQNNHHHHDGDNDSDD